MSCCSGGRCREEAVRGAVPPGSAPYTGRHKDAFRTSCTKYAAVPETGKWTLLWKNPYNLLRAKSKKVREVLCALSGGVDSSVAAVLLSKAVGSQLTCVFVDHGLLRKNEGDEVEAVFEPEGHYNLNFIRVNAQERFYES